MEKIVIGQIAKPQGIKGEIKITPLTEDISRFTSLKEVYLGTETRQRTVSGCRIANNSVLMYIDGILTRNDAEAARGQFISIDKENALPLSKGEYFISDIIGCKIYDQGGAYLGIVKNIIKNGAADVYEAEKDGKTFMFPYIERLQAAVDIQGKKITVNGTAFSEVACYED